MLQAAMLPKLLPEAPGLELAARYLPAEVGVGGDWYDAMIQPDGRLLARDRRRRRSRHRRRHRDERDPHRLSAWFSLNESSPSRILHKLNTFTRRTNRVDLVTALIVLLDPVTGEATLASAGHLPPVIAHDGQAGLVDLRVSAPLGISVIHPHETTIALEPGATLLLYTDGLVERRTGSIDARMQELADRLRNSDLHAAEIVDDVVAHMLPTGPPSDDVAVIAVTRSSDRALRCGFRPTARTWRQFADLMRRWLTVQGASEEDTHDLVLAVGELAANACTHATPMVAGTFTVDAEQVDGVVDVTVSDHGRWRPPLDRGGGRGLKIVRAVVDTLLIDSDDRGTRAHIRHALRRGRRWR